MTTARRPRARRAAAASDSRAQEIPLNALPVFCAAARHESFTLAARELRVTQAAVSHQVGLLERFLGLRLFRRVARGVVLTEEGSEYLSAAREALAHLEEATRRVRAGRGSCIIVCSIATTIAMRWLVPRLRSFASLNASIDVRLSITERFVDFATENVDVAIRYGSGSWPGLVSALLFREVLVPVCAPELLRRSSARLSARNLRTQKLLHAASTRGDWKAWLVANSVAGVDARAGIVFDQPHLAVQAAADGLGIAMADRWLVREDLIAGRLVVPVEGVLARAEGYYVVGPESARDSLHVGAFWRWLLTQAVEGPLGREIGAGGMK